MILFRVLLFRRSLCRGKSWAQWSDSQPCLMVFLQYPWSPLPPILPAPELAKSHGTIAIELASNCSEEERLGAIGVGYTGIRGGWERSSWWRKHSQYLSERPQQGTRLSSQSRVWNSLVMESEHEQPENPPGWRWLIALNITLCFPIMLSRYGAKKSTRLP